VSQATATCKNVQATVRAALQVVIHAIDAAKTRGDDFRLQKSLVLNMISANFILPTG